MHRGVLDRKSTEARMPIELIPVHNIYRGCGGFSKEKTEDGDARLGKRRIYTLAYVDDLAMMAETKREMKKMLKSLERYLEEKELILNADKSKMLICKKKRIKQERNWKWKDSKIEEVKEFKYLGFTFKKSNIDEAHVKDIVRKAAAAMGTGLGDRRKEIWRKLRQENDDV